jgi:hypothetical protein
MICRWGAGQGGVRQSQRELGGDDLTTAFRRTRRVWWRGLRDRGVLELRKSLARVRVWRQQDPIEGELDVLVLKQERNHVSNVRRVKVRRGGAEGDRGGPWLTVNRQRSLLTAAARRLSDLGSLVADLLGFWDRRVWNGGSLYRRVRERKLERNRED